VGLEVSVVEEDVVEFNVVVLILEVIFLEAAGFFSNELGEVA
jgi:hypothetical protein